MRGRDRISLVFGGAAVLVSVLVIGGALRWTQAVVALLVAAALAMQLGSRRRLDHASPLVVLLGIAIALTAVQLIPLPDGVLDLLDAQGNQLRNDGAALAAAVTGLHTLFNADRLYGVYAPHHATPQILGPLLNANHLGGVMAIGAVLAIGLVFYQRQAVQLRVLWVVIGIGCSATAMASLSRGATLGLGLGIVTTIAILFAGRLGVARGETSRPRRALVNDVPIVIVVAFGLAVAVYTSAGKVADQLENTTLTELHQPLSKYAAWRSSFQLLDEAPLVGIGRGAIEPAFTRVHASSAYVTFSHLENEYIQAVVEWGVPGALALGLALAWCIATALRRWRDGPLAAAAIGACAAITFQSSVDFGVELLGVAVPALLAVTTLLGGRLRESRSPVVTASRVAVIVALVGAAGVLVLPATRSVQEDHDWLTAGDAATLADAREVMARHPLDYLSYGQAAAAMLRTGDPQAGKLLNHALRLHPTHPGLHRLAARMFIASGRRSQGAVEYALALHGTLAPKHLITEIVTLLPEVELAAAAIPIDAVNPQPILRTLGTLDRNDVAERWLQRAVLGPDRDLAMIDELYQLAIARRDLPVAEQAARLRLAGSRTNASRILLARVMFRRESFDQVLKDLADVPGWTGRIDEQADAWFLVCDTHIEKRAWDPALECLHKLDGAGIIDPARRGDLVKRFTIVNEHRASEAKQKAIEEMERALGSRPKSP